MANDLMRSARSLLQRLSPWRSVAFRYLAYEAAVYGGRAWRWLMSSWRPHALGLMAIAGLAIARRAWIEGAKDWWSPVSGLRPEHSTHSLVALADVMLAWPGSWTKVFLVYALVLVAVVYWRGKDRLLILAPANHAGERFNDLAEGLELRIMNELKRLGSLHAMPARDADRDSGADFKPAQADKSEVPGIRIGVDDDTRRFAAVVDDSATVSLGPAKISLKSLLNLLAALGRRNPLRSSLHRDGDKLVLVAELGASGAWRIEADMPDSAAASERAERWNAMLDQLVYSVFRTLSRLNGLNWSALRHLSVGLRALREAQASNLQRFETLREAEREFLAARGLSPGFARVPYLLGVVYTEMGKDCVGEEHENCEASARAAFLQALSDNPHYLDANYAIAYQCFQRGESAANQYAIAVEFSDRMIEIDRKDARAWNIRGVAQRREMARAVEEERKERAALAPASGAPQPPGEGSARGQQDNEEEERTGRENQRIWRESLEDRRTAVVYLWRSLCREAWAGGVSGETRTNQTEYLSNLGVSIANSDCWFRWFRMERVLSQALHKNPASRPAREMARVWDDRALQARRWGESARVIAHRSRMAEQQWSRALFSAKTFPERAAIRAWLTASLYRWRREREKEEEYFRFKVQDALAKMVESPSLLRCSAWAELAGALGQEVEDRFLPSEFAIKSAVNSQIVVLTWTHIWYKVWHLSVFQKSYDYNIVDFINYSYYTIDRKKLREIKNALYQIARNQRRDSRKNSDSIKWSRACLEIAAGVLYFNLYSSAPQSGGERLLRKSISHLRNGVRALSQPDAFAREEIIGSAYRFLADAEVRLSQDLSNPMVRKFILPDLLNDAVRARARKPLEVASYQTLQSAHATRAEFKAATDVAEKGQSLDVANLDLLFSRVKIVWTRGTQLSSRSERMSSLESTTRLLIENLERSVDDGYRGFIQFWLGRFRVELCQYDLAREHLRVAQRLGFGDFECGVLRSWTYVEQGLFGLAEGDLRETLSLFRIAKLSFKTTLAKRQTGGAGRNAATLAWFDTVDSGEGQPVGFLFARALLLCALVCCNRGQLQRAERRLNLARWVIDSLVPERGTTREMITLRQEALRGLRAGDYEVQGRMLLAGGHTGAAISALEQSFLLSEDVGVAYELAKALVEEAEKGPKRGCGIEKAEQTIQYAYHIDFRNMNGDKLKTLAERVAEFRQRGNLKPSVDDRASSRLATAHSRTRRVRQIRKRRLSP
jgi:hypothetical protein